MDTLDFQPIFKTKAIVVQSASDKKTDPVVMIAELGPHESGPPLHFHPNQHETYEVLEGEAEFVLGGEKIIVRQGEKVDIPANTPHTFKNLTGNWLKMKDTHIPALSFEEMMRELHGLVQHVKISGFNNPKSLIYLSMLWVKHREIQESVNPPFFVMKLLNFAGKLMGFRL
ncbi:MAG: cupin domain-containing protein [Sphingobacteriales bacterium]|nr:MAG: cupin domain-containing protein [Sphingobacteriales bacterium]